MGVPPVQPATPPNAPPADPRVRPLVFIAVIAALFCAVVGIAMLLRNWQTQKENPLLSPQAVSLKEQLRTDPNSDPLKQQIRALDVQLRRRYFQHLDLLASGKWVLLSGGCVLLAAALGTRRITAKRPRPGKKLDAAQAGRDRRFAAWAVFGTGAAAAAALFALAVTSEPSRLPATAADADKLLKKLSGEPDEADLTTLPKLAELRANWPRFLGAEGNAFATNVTLPNQVDPASGAGIAWKVAVPAPGFNSPIVWGNRVYLSGGDATNRGVFAFDVASGAVAWQRPVANVPGSPPKQPDIQEATGYAASTMACDGRRVYVIFANGDLAAFTLEGTPVWSKNIGVPKNQYGYATSLAVWQGRLIVQFDQGDADQGLSKLIAFDGATGRVAWQQSRKVPESWASPIVVEAAGKAQIITLTGKWVIAHSALDGTELWRVEGLSGEITPSPNFAGGLVLAISPSDKLLAIRPDGAGDVTKTHIAWKAEDNIPDISSPVSNGELVFLATSGGMLTCYDLKDGKKLWEQDTGVDMNATPAIAGDQLVLFGVKGKGLIAGAGREFKQIAKLDLGEAVQASPALAAGRVFVRGATNLFCIGPPSTPAAPPTAAKQP